MFRLPRISAPLLIRPPTTMLSPVTFHETARTPSLSRQAIDRSLSLETAVWNGRIRPSLSLISSIPPVGIEMRFSQNSSMNRTMAWDRSASDSASRWQRADGSGKHLRCCRASKDERPHRSVAMSENVTCCIVWKDPPDIEVISGEVIFGIYTARAQNLRHLRA
jgi:hypothetical protein